MENKTIFITGGAGFIASHLIERLLENNKVIIYDNYVRNSTKFAAALLKHKNLTTIKGNVLDANNLLDSSKGADIIVHCAAVAGIYSVGSKVATTMKVNLIGSYNVLEAAIKNKIEKVIDFSTSEVYGSFIYCGKETDNTVIGPVGERRWVYAVSKLASEHLTHAYSEEHNLETISVRPFNVYGPRQVGEGAVQQMVLRALRNKDIIVYNEGVQIRAWCYVSDFVDALYEILESNVGNKVFNIGNPQTAITVLGLAQKIVEMTNSKSKITFRKHPGTEIEVRIPNIEQAKTLLGFEPRVSLDEGLKKTISWYEQHLMELA